VARERRPLVGLFPANRARLQFHKTSFALLEFAELQCAAPNLVAMRTKDSIATLSDMVIS